MTRLERLAYLGIIGARPLFSLGPIGQAADHRAESPEVVNTNMINRKLGSLLACATMMSVGLPTISLGVELKDTVVASIKAEVLYVNAEARQLYVMELEGPGADEMDPMATSNWFLRSFSVSPDVAAFEFVRAGDKVLLGVNMALTIDIRKPTEDEAKTGFSSITVTEKEGMLNHVITAVCEVTAIDTKNSRITFKGPKGRLFAVPVAKGDLSGKAKVGDKVVINYTQGVVVSLARAQ